MQAVNAQFDQVFGDLGGKATQVLSEMGEEFNMLPQRLKAPLAQTTSMFKGLGLDTETAMTTAAQAVTMASDAAAFYDKSFEDANAALNSFIKGSYEGGESIGLFANETQLAAWAAKELGVDWKTLDEAGKQVARLEFAQAMQEAAGATGQASREGEALTNVQGNLKSAWTTMLATLGEPILPMVTDWMTKLTDAILNFDAEELIAQVKDFYERGKETIKMIKDFLDVWSPLLAGIAAGVLAYKTITAGIVAYNAILAAYRAVTLLATTGQLGLNAVMLANPIGLVVVAIGLLVAAGVLLYKNWDTVKAKLSELWTAFKTKFDEIRATVEEKMGKVKSFLSGIDLVKIGKDIINGLKDGILDAAGSLYRKAEEIAEKVKGIFTGLFKVHSPSRWMRDEIGVNIGKGFIAGLDSVESRMLSTATNLSGNIQDALAYSVPSVSASAMRVRSYEPAKASASPANVTNHYHATIDAKNVKDFTDVVKLFDGKTIRAWGSGSGR